MKTSSYICKKITAEEFLQEKNFKQFHVRIHGNLARIEILPLREEIVKDLKNFGFDYVSTDLQGYRTGSMNIF